MGSLQRDQDAEVGAARTAVDLDQPLMLLNEGLLVKETAGRLGFPDAFQFSRAFKRVHGISPGRLLESRGAGEDEGR